MTDSFPWTDPNQLGSNRRTDDRYQTPSLLPLRQAETSQLPSAFPVSALMVMMFLALSRRLHQDNCVLASRVQGWRIGIHCL